MCGLISILVGLVACGAQPHDAETCPPVSPQDTTLFGLPFGDTEGAPGRILEVDADQREVWRYTLPPDINPFGTYLLDVDYTEAGTILYTVENMGIYEVDRSGNLLWSYADPDATHDVDRLPDGNTLFVRGWAPRGEPQVVEVDPSGQVVWSWDGLAAFPDEPYTSMSDEGGAWMHPNGVQRLSNGDTLVCSRNFNILVVVDPGGEVVDSLSFSTAGSETSVPSVGVVHGSHPHDGRLVQDETRFMVALHDPGWVVEITRDTHEPVWKWTAPKGDISYDTLRTATPLSSGNRLITTRSRILEVSVEGEILWDYEGPAVPHAFSNDSPWLTEDTGFNEGLAMLPKPVYRAIRLEASGVKRGG